MATTATAMRFTDEDLALLDALRAKLGLVSRTDVVRLALRRLADLERLEQHRPKKQ